MFSNGSKVAGKLPSQQMDNSLSSRGSNFKSKVCQEFKKKKKGGNLSSSLWLGMDAVFCFSDCSNNFSVTSNVCTAVLNCPIHSQMTDVFGTWCKCC